MLTDAKVRNLKAKQQPYWEIEKTSQRGAGRLAIKVLPNGRKEWYFRFKSEGRQRTLKLGVYPDLPLAEARELFGQHSRLYQQGVDPKEHQLAQERASELRNLELQRAVEAERRKGSFSQLTSSYVSQLRVEGKRSADSVEYSFKRYVFDPFPELALYKANDISVAHIREILAKMIDKGITTQANRVRSYLHAAFQHGLKQDNNPRTYSDVSVLFHLESNPVAAIPRQADYERPLDRVLTEAELRELWNGIETVSEGEIPGNYVIQRFIRFILATGGQRVLELLRSEWSHVDEAAATLLIPAANSKPGRDHVVPLSRLAMEVLEELKPATGSETYIFPGVQGRRRTSERHMRADSVSHAIQKFHLNHPAVGHFTPRDLRRTVKTLLGQSGVAKEIRDRLQNHAFNDVSSRHYDRYDYLTEKRQAIDIWASRLELILSPVENVTFIGCSA